MNVNHVARSFFLLLSAFSLLLLVFVYWLNRRLCFIIFQLQVVTFCTSIEQRFGYFDTFSIFICDTATNLSEAYVHIDYSRFKDQRIVIG